MRLLIGTLLCIGSAGAIQMSARGKKFLTFLKRKSTPQQISLLESRKMRTHHMNRLSVRHRMSIVHKTAYWGQVKIGGQSFNVIFDTGSGNLIIPTTACNGAGCSSHKRYDPNEATGNAVTNDHGESEAEISFGTGDIAGKFFNDKLCLGEGGQICVNVNFIGSTQQSAEPFAATPFDGIMGLGFRDLSMGGGFNIIDDLVDKGALPNGMFSFALADEGPSSITFGGYRPEAVYGDIVWSQVTIPSYWQIRTDDIMLNNEMTGLCGDQGCQVAVDTGTSMLAGPSSLIEQLTNKVSVKEDCSNYKSLPVLGFKIGNKVLNLRPDEYVDNDKGQSCSFSLMSLDVPPPKGPLFIFGDPFLRRFVTVFDRENSRVGFGVSARGGESNRHAITDYTPPSASKSSDSEILLVESGRTTQAQNLKSSWTETDSSSDPFNALFSDDGSANNPLTALVSTGTKLSSGKRSSQISNFDSAVDISLAAGMMEGEEANQENKQQHLGAKNLNSRKRSSQDTGYMSSMYSTYTGSSDETWNTDYDRLKRVALEQNQITTSQNLNSDSGAERALSVKDELQSLQDKKQLREAINMVNTLEEEEAETERLMGETALIQTKRTGKVQATQQNLITIQLHQMPMQTYML